MVIDEENGLFIRLHHEVMRRANIDAQLDIQPAKRIQKSFKYGKIEAYFPELTENTSKQDIITTQAFFLKKISVFTLKSSDIKTLADLNHKTVGAVRGYSYGEEITNNPNFTLSYVDNDEANIQRLIRGYIDAIIGDAVSTLAAIKNSRYEQQIFYAHDRPIHVLDAFYVCQNSPSGKALCESIDKALTDMKNEGIIELNRTTGLTKLNL